MEEKWYSDKEEEEEEEMRETSKHSFLSSSSSSASSSKYQSFFPQHQKLWQLGTSESSQEEAAAARSYYNQAAPPLQLLDLSLGNNDNDIEADGGGSGTGGGSIEREHMFDKVVTPSDVGKLNRLVIPKQYAEKYFPFDTSTNEKGLLLNFEDRNGKSWRFRYSYWNSSQSYVMTKGWSRFVKEKKLDPGDIVSFQRGVGELQKDHLYIDWRRRPEVPNHPTSLTPHLHLPNHHQRHFPQSVRWASRLYSLPSSVSMSVSMPRSYDHLQQINYNVHPYHNPHHHHRYNHQNQHHHHHQSSIHDYNRAMNSDSAGSLYYLRSSASHDQIGTGAPQGGEVLPMVIDSVPVAHHDKTPAKRLRLFGVNMECSTPEEPEYPMLSSATMASSFSPQLKLPVAVPLPTLPGEFSKKGKSSLTFDADP